MNPEKMMEDLMKELSSAIKAMSNAKTVEEKISYSQLIRNLSESMGVFLHFSSPIENEYDEDE